MWHVNVNRNLMLQYINVAKVFIGEANTISLFLDAAKWVQTRLLESQAEEQEKQSVPKSKISPWK